MRTGKALWTAFILVLCGCASAPKTPVPAAGHETEINFTNSEWAPFADYMKEFTTSIHRRWYQILAESRVSPRRGSQVVVHFKISSNGETEIVDIEDKHCGKQGVLAAIAAMDASRPHPKWTDEMIAKLGTEQTLSFAFIYQ